MKGWSVLRGFLFVALAGFVLRAGDTWNSGPVVARIAIQSSAARIEDLRREPRGWVACEVEVDGARSLPAKMRVKGAIGSFQPIDELPSLTLDASRDGGVFRGVSRIHLDNSAQDPGRLDAAFGAAAFQRIGIDSPRVRWAIVSLNGRDLGWYVLKEGFTAEYVRRAMGKSVIVLGEPLAGGDVGDPFDIKAGADETEQDAAREVWSRLGELCRAGEPDARWIAMERWVDRRRLLDFSAMEVILAHRDGYTLARNNYRVVFQDQRVRWMPWGMDQLLVSDGYPLEPEFSGEMLRSIRQATGFEVAWRDAIRRSAELALDPEWWEGWLETTRARVSPELRFRDRAALRRGLSGLRRRLVGRRQHVVTTLAAWNEPGPAWTNGVLRLSDWRAVDVPRDGRAESLTNSAVLSGPMLMLSAGVANSSSWRSSVRLQPGSYRFSGRVRTSGVQPLPFGTHHGVALRVLGEEVRSMELVGDNNWRELSVDFRVADQARVLSLICELRGRAGQVWFDRGSLQLLRLK